MAIGTFTVKERILLHLFDYNRFEDEYTVPIGVTQSGIADAVGIRVHHVSQNARPLISEGLVQESTRHIQGRPRRQKAYFLTGQGRSHVASMRGSLLATTVSFRPASGNPEEVPFATVYHERKRGGSVLQLLGELGSKGFIAETVPGAEAPEIVDFTQDAPEVESFYGREEDLRRLTELLQETPLVVVTGIGGIGKSTLGSKVCEQERSVRSLFWQRIRPWTAPTDLARNLGRFLRAAGRGRLDAHIARSTSTDWARIEDALSADFAGFASLLVFDDAHTASEETLEFLSMLHAVLQRDTGSTALLLTRERPPFYSRREVEVEKSVREMSLGGLDRGSAELLLLDGGVPRSQIRELSRVSGGSPLFLRILARAKTGAEVREGLDTVEAYIAEEIEPALTAEERDVMQAASLYETPVPPEALLQESRIGTGVILGLHRKGLLEKAGAGQFSLHDAVRAYFQGGLSSERRRDLASRATPWLLDEAERLAHEGNPSAAVAYLENAVTIEPSGRGRADGLERMGDLRHQTGDTAGARRAYRSALDETEEPSTKARLHFKIAGTLEFQARLEESEAELDRGLGLLPTSPSLEAGWLLWSKAEMARWKREYEKAFAGYERVWNWLPQLPEDADLKGTLATWMGILKLYNPGERDPVAAKDYLDVAAETLRSRPKPSPFQMADPFWLSLGFKAQACMQMGQIDEALRLLDEVLTIVTEAGYPFGRLWGLIHRAWCLSECLGESEEALELYEEAHQLAHDLSRGLRELWLHRNFADVYRLQSRYVEAKESQEHFLKSSGDEAFEGEKVLGGENKVESLVFMVRLCVRCGDWTEAHRYLEEAEALARSLESDTARFYVDWGRAVLWGGEGREEDARRAYQNALEIGPMCPWPAMGQDFLATMAYEGEFLLDYGRFLVSIGDKSHAERILLRAKEEVSGLGRKPLENEVERAFESLNATAS